MQTSCESKRQTYVQLKWPENALQYKDIAQFIINQGQRKLEIAATLVFVCTGHKLLTGDHSDFVTV